MPSVFILGQQGRAIEAACARPCRLEHRRDIKAFVSKVMVFEKKAG
jgi:hypothetical protein